MLIYNLYSDGIHETRIGKVFCNDANEIIKIEFDAPINRKFDDIVIRQVKIYKGRILSHFELKKDYL